MQSTEPATSAEDIAALTTQAESALANEDWRAAANAYERLVASEPTNAHYRFNLVRAYDELGQADEALKVLQHPGIAHLSKTKQRLARTYIDLKDYAAAIPLVDELVAAQPGNPKFAKWKAFLEEKSGPDQIAAERMRRGQELFDSGNLEEAEQLCSLLLSDYPGFALASLYLGKIYAQQKRWTEAVPLLREGLKTDPGNAKLRNSLARALFKSGDLEGAIALLGSGAGPGDHIDSTFLLQRSHFELHQWALSEQFGRRLLAVLPADDRLRETVIELCDEARFKSDIEKVDALAAAGKVDEALVQYGQVAERHAWMPLAWLTLGSALTEWGRVDEAAAALRKALVLHPENVEIRTALSRAVIGSADEQQILEHVRCATSAGGGGDFESFRWLARYHARREEWPQSLEAARRALEFDPTSASAKVMLVRALLNLDHLDEALEEADALLAIGEKQAEALQLKADVLVRLSRVDEAITLYCQALSRSRRNPVVIERLHTALLESRIEDYPMRTLAELPFPVDPARVDELMLPFLNPEIDDFGWRRRQRKVWRQAVDRVAAGQQSTRDRKLIKQEYAVWASMGFDRYRTDRDDLTGSLWSWRGRRLFVDGAAAARVRAVWLSAVLDQLKPRRVLEVGSGNGINLLTLAGAFPKIEFTGVELTRQGVDEARRAQSSAQVRTIIEQYSPAPAVDPSAMERISFIRGDASALPFEDASFDLVITILAVEQMESIRSAALSEISRVSSGHVLMLEPFRELNQAGLQALYVRSRGYFRGSIRELRDVGLEPLWATDDFPQETFLGTALVLAKKQPPKQ